MLVRMDEGRKRLLAIVAAILAAGSSPTSTRNRAQLLNLTIADAVEKAERILQRIDAVWPGR